MATTITTRDIGLAVRDALEHLTHVPIYQDDEHGDDTEVARMEIWNVDVSDPSNVLIDMANGQTFVLRVVASARP